MPKPTRSGTRHNVRVRSISGFLLERVFVNGLHSFRRGCVDARVARPSLRFRVTSSSRGKAENM